MLYPRNSESRTVINLNGIWDFKLDSGNGMKEKWLEKRLQNPIKMPVPASYNDLQEGYDFRNHCGLVFYQRDLIIPRALLESPDRLVLRFGAVTHKAKVYINEELAAKHIGGFLPFEVELDKSGLHTHNLLTVCVDNRIDYSTLPVGREDHPDKNEANFDFFNYSGIIRPVLLYTTPRTYIEDITIIPAIDTKKAALTYTVNTKTDISHDSKTDHTVHIELLTRDGELVSDAHGIKGTLTVDSPCLWEPQNPYLYQVRISCSNDVYEFPYGIRTVAVKGNEFLINEKPFYFRGFGKHEDTCPNGRGFNEVANVKDLSLFDWIGANSFRTSHYPYSEEMMQLCDEKGIVVIDEVPAVGLNIYFGGGANHHRGIEAGTFSPENEGGIRTASAHQKVIQDLIKRDKNFACVVMWSIANEPDGSAKGAYSYFKPLFDMARKEDPQCRPCTMASVAMENFKDDCTLKLSDVYCLNRYYGWYIACGDLSRARSLMQEEMEFWNSTGKPFMLTEYGADTISGYHDSTPRLFTEEYQMEYYKMNHDVIDRLDNFIGEQVWNFADFDTEENLTRVCGNKKGLFTRDRKPKLAAHYFRERWHQPDKYH